MRNWNFSSNETFTSYVFISFFKDMMENRKKDNNSDPDAKKKMMKDIVEGCSFAKFVDTWIGNFVIMGH